jgi:heme-degrading monooxygenase HmoA
MEVVRMYARVASFENRDPSLADDLVGAIRDRSARNREELPDARGALMLVDREGNSSLGIVFFDSEEAIREAAPVFDRMGDDYPEELRGQRASVEVYEVMLAEGGEGAQAARLSILEGPADRIDEGTLNAREEILPQVSRLDGFKGAVSLADRERGRTKLITLWESSDALRASEEPANQLRQRAAEGAAARVVEVKRFEVALSEGIGRLSGVR